MEVSGKLWFSVDNNYINDNNNEKNDDNSDNDDNGNNYDNDLLFMLKMIK